MKIGTVIIGNELLLGKISDTHVLWLARFLASKGLSLYRVWIVPDETEILINSLQDAFNECDLIIVTGGLGPTQDDLTKSALAAAFSKKIVWNEQALTIAKENYQRLNYPFDLEKSHYAEVPEEFAALGNPCGAAPGLYLYDNEKNKLLVALPGVPSELQAMFKEQCWPLISDKLVQDHKLTKRITARTRFVPEEKIFSKIAPGLWQELAMHGTVSSLPQVVGVDVGVVFNANNNEELAKKEQIITNIINHSPLRSIMWQIGEIPLADYVLAKARDKEITISLAESCTGGLVASRLTDVAGSSSVFMGGINCYSNTSKVDLLRVDPQAIEQYGSVSLEVTEQMAQGAKMSFGTDLAIAVSGILGPAGGSDHKPVGSVCMSVVSADDALHQSYRFRGDRLKLKLRFSELALFLLLDAIEQY